MEILKSIHDFGGSEALRFISDAAGMPIDQINFIVCQLVALGLSGYLKHKVRAAEGRLWFCLVAGMCITAFCFGSQMGHILAMGGMSYLIMESQKSSGKMPWYVLGFSMLYLSFLHWRRQFWEEPGDYKLDVTGPLMILTQKVSSLAFSIRDGRDAKKADANLTELKQRYLVEKVPSPLEFFSFLFQFQSILAGPLVMYRDFDQFVHREKHPSSRNAVIRKVFESIIYAGVFVKFGPMFHVSRFTSEEFFEESWAKKVLLMVVITTVERFKYYHAWVLSDAVCNASGLGYDEEQKNWDLTTNVRPVSFDLGTSFKESLDQWNIGTGKWLRHVMYERVGPSQRTLFTYLLSAIWHGYYPGYYLTFLTGALFTSSARVVRRFCRPWALKSAIVKTLYDVITLIFTRMAVAYCTFSFMILDFGPSLVVYKHLYFYLHIMAVVAMYGMPPVFKALGIAPTPPARQPRSTTATTEDAAAPVEPQSTAATTETATASSQTNGVAKLKTG